MSQAKSSNQKSYEGHKDRSLIRPDFAEGKPVKPPGMLPEASKLWDSTVVQLINQGVVTAVDQQSLEGLCYWWAIFVGSQASLATIDDWATIIATRAVSNASRAWDNYRRLATQFGLSPQARNTVSAAPQGDELDDYE